MNIMIASGEIQVFCTANSTQKVRRCLSDFLVVERALLLDLEASFDEGDESMVEREAAVVEGSRSSLLLLC